MGARSGRIILVGDQEAEKPIHYRGKNNEGEEAPIPPAIKKVGGQQAYPNSRTPPRAKIQGKKYSNKDEKGKAVKDQT